MGVNNHQSCSNCGGVLLIPISTDDVALLVIGGQIGLLVVTPRIRTRVVISCTLKSTDREKDLGEKRLRLIVHHS